MRRLRVALAQLNPTVGAVEANYELALNALEEARSQAADLVVFPELFLTGYPPEDLLLKPQFLEANVKAMRELAKASQGLVALVGFADLDNDAYNAAAVLADGKLAGIYHKNFLPNYGVFDERRYFAPGQDNFVFQWDGIRFGVSICEDMWYQGGVPHEQAVLGGAQVLVNLSSSPYYRGKGYFRQRMLATRASNDLCALVYCNLVGGQDELVFDGQSLVFDQEGNLVLRAPQFEEGLFVCDLDLDTLLHSRLKDPRSRQERASLLAEGAKPLRSVELDLPLPEAPKPECKPVVAHELDPVAEVAAAIKVGLRDYVDKNGFERVALGLSGGIDSALTAVFAVQALGKERVTALAMPSKYSSEHSKSDAAQLAENLGIPLHFLPIQEVFEAYKATLSPLFGDLPEDVTEQNLQARIRGNLLMAWSNKFRGLILTTGNKSEVSVGYSTLYGDMAGGFAPIKDVPKTLVYKLARHVNAEAGYDLIPANILSKPPSAELKPDQTDQDDLPPYAMLDEIIELYVEKDLDASLIVARGFPLETVRKVVRMIDRTEYKRRQAPPGVKITPRAFGKDRRMPITSKYREL